MLPLPTEGRVFAGRRKVRFGDTTPQRRARFDALARYLHDVAEDDAADAGWLGSVGWLLRSTQMSIRQFPVLGETLTLQTFCSATATRWAERTTTITGSDGGSVQATAIWIAVDITTGGPVRLDDSFTKVYGPSARGRRASARLHLAPPPAHAAARGRRWPLRASDYDVWHHVNNAVAWAAIEDSLATAGWLPVRAELEHNEPIPAGSALVLSSLASETSLDAWLLDGGGGGGAGGDAPGDGGGDRVLASARLHRFEPE